MTRNSQPNISRPHFHTDMSRKEGSESQCLIDSSSSYRYARTYSSLEETSGEGELQENEESPQNSTPSESLFAQMQREINQDQIGTTSNTCHRTNGMFAWLFPKKKKKKKRRRRRANRSEYSRHDAERLQAQMVMLQSSSSVTKRKTNIVGWLWGVFLLMTLGWVCIFTLSEGHIDWAEIINYAPQHQTPALQQKAGIRLLSFFGIGYLLPGVLSLLSLFVGLKLPYVQKNNPALSKLVQLPRYGTTYWSMMDLQLLLLFVIVLVGAFIVRFWHKYDQLDGPNWTPDILWRYIVKISGMSLVTILLVVLFPICKTCFWWDVFGLGFDRIIKFHRLLGALFGVILLLHGLASLVYLDMVDQLFACWAPWSTTCEKSMVVYGWYAGILFLPVFATSFSSIRRNRYELFYYCHLLVIPALLMAHLHHINLIYYTSPSLVAYTLDKIVGYFAARRPVQLVDLSVPVSGYTRMTLAVDPNNADFLPGQWIKVKVPAISNWEWHPFSITSAPNQSTITLDIKTMGGWSSKLQELAKSVSAGSNSRTSPTKPDAKRLPSVFLDRYQGCDHTQGFLDHRAALLVGGGIGITPMMSVLRSVAADGLPKLEHLVFVWVVRNESVAGLYREELAMYQALGGIHRNGRKCKVDILVYVTRPTTYGTTSGNESVFLEAPRTFSNDGDETDKVKNVAFGSYYKPAPFSKTILGHMHHALLMIAIGFGFLHGIVTGSYLADVNEWRQEVAVLLQLGLGLVFSSIVGAIVILGGGLVKSRSRQKKPRRGGGNQVPMQGNTSTLDPENSSGAPPLEVHLGERPNVPQIVGELKQQCLQADIPSVGVSVCGPDKLTKSVLTCVYEASSPFLEFIMGEESFEW